MIKWILAFILSALLFSPAHARADSFNSNGQVENTSGTLSNVLFYRHFKITPDGRISGYIENKSHRVIRGLVIDMYTMDQNETRVFWRKILDIGNMAPGGRYVVNEPYSPVPDDSSKIVYRFKIHGSDEYRIPDIR